MCVDGLLQEVSRLLFFCLTKMFVHIGSLSFHFENVFTLALMWLLLSVVYSRRELIRDIKALTIR